MRDALAQYGFSRKHVYKLVKITHGLFNLLTLSNMVNEELTLVKVLATISMTEYIPLKKRGERDHWDLGYHCAK